MDFSTGSVRTLRAAITSQKPIGVSAFKLTKALPQELKDTLPSIRELEVELGREPTK